MGLLSIFKRKASGAANAVPTDAVQLARVRARRRLIGAAVLLVIGIIGFPLLFETQQRPIPVDVQIEIPSKDSARPLEMPVPAVQPVAQGAGINEPESGVDRVLAPSPKAVMPPAEAPKSRRAAGVPTTALPHDTGSEAALVTALLEGNAAKASAVTAQGERFVVQVGAFSDAAAARKARHKLVALGLKTYVQIANKPAGKLIRVRAGPYATREEANNVATKIKQTSLPTAVLKL